MISEHRLSQVFILLTFLVLTCANFGCTSSRIVNEWRDPSFGNQPLKHMLVIAPRKDPVNRRLWEDVFVGGLAQQGVDATPAYRMFGDSMPSPEQVAASVPEKNFDGILMVKRLTTQLATYYVPGTARAETVQQFNRFTKNYEFVIHEVQDPGYTDTDRVVRNEINVFTTGGTTGTLVWAGTGETIDPTSREAVKDEIANLIIPELARLGIIPKK